MLQSQRSIIEAGKSIMAVVKSAELPESVVAHLREIVGSAQVRELVVPVVGAFSSGKTTLINQFLGEERLPTGITPETSLATELRYSSEQFIEGIKPDGTVDRHSIDDFNTLKDNASQYSYAKVYLSNENLKNIQPLVLVDMPGFDSPLDAHNKAIFNYFTRGSYYIILASVEEGTIQKPLLRRMEEIEETGRDFSFFVSKANLRAPDSVKELVEHFSDIVQTQFGNDKTVSSVADDSESLERVLKGVDAEKLFLDLFQEDLKAAGYDAIEALNDRIKAIKREDADNKALMDELASGLKKVEQKRDSLITDLEGKYSHVMVDDIVNKVGKELNSALDELSQVASNGNSDEFSRRISEIARTTLMSVLRQKLGKINKDIVGEFSFEMKNLDQVLEQMGDTNDFSEMISAKVQGTFDQLKREGENLFSLAGQKGSGDAVRQTYKTISTILAVTTSVVAPIVEIVLIFLPEIINLFGKGSQQKKQEEVIRQKLTQEIFPEIKRKIRTSAPEILNQQIGEMIKQVSQEYEEVLANKRAATEKGMAEKRENQKQIQEKLSALTACRDEVKTHVNQILEWN